MAVKMEARFGVVGSAVAVFILSFIVALLTWWAFADPTLPFAKAVGWADTFPFPFLFIVVWLILYIVWFGFNFQLSIFDWLPKSQPARGASLTLISLVMIGVSYLTLNEAWGRVNPNFHPSTATGYLLSAFIVLIGFFTFTAMSITFQHWPFEGLKQPLQGLAVWLLGLALTFAFFFALVYPAAVHPTNTPLDFYTMTGWWYSVIVGLLIVSLTFANWPLMKTKTAAG